MRQAMRQRLAAARERRPRVGRHLLQGPGIAGDPLLEDRRERRRVGLDRGPQRDPRERPDEGNAGAVAAFAAAGRGTRPVGLVGAAASGPARVRCSRRATARSR
jgi:hypothetical protein